MASSRGGEPVPTTPIPQLLSSQPIFSTPWLDVREDVLLWLGASERRYGIVTVKPGVTVLALDEPTGMVWCVWQYRPAIGRVSLELVGGGMEDGERPLDAAQRELAEEAGVAAGRWNSLGVLHAEATTSTRLLHRPFPATRCSGGQCRGRLPTRRLSAPYR